MSKEKDQKSPLSIVLASPRGFCAGVDRAIQIVEKALLKFGAPVYVRHEIVHNEHVVASLAKKGAVFVEELHQVPEGGHVVYSAHGVPKSVPEEAQRRHMIYLDATCPLVSKVHREAENHFKKGYPIILIGHRNHPEVVGTMGQLPPGSVVLVESLEDVDLLSLPVDEHIAYVTQTTLSIDDTREIVEALQKKYPHLLTPRKEDICYATTNRQKAVREIAPHVDRLIVIGSHNSSNSLRLVEVSKSYGCQEARLYPSVDQVDWAWVAEGHRLGVTAGASAPEILVDRLIEACHERFEVNMEEVLVAEENIHFNLPKILW